MTCNHEPEDRIAGEATTCRHCRVEIEAIPCAECGGGVAHWREVGAMNEFNEHTGRMRAARNLSRNPMVAVFTCVWPFDPLKHGVWLKDFAIGPDGKTSFVGDLFDCVKWVNESRHTKSGKTWAQLQWEALERRRLETLMKPKLGPGGWREAR